MQGNSYRPTVQDASVEDIPPSITLQAPRPTKDYAKLGGPLANFKTANFVGSANCSMCHEELEDSKGDDLSISRHWRATMMANSAKDPFWQAKVKSEAQRNPSLAKSIEENCVRCHMPMAWVQAQTEKEAFRAANSTSLLDTFMDPNSALHEAAMDGVSCSLCHQIKASGVSSVANFNGKFTIDTSTAVPNRPIYGPYRDVYQKTMIDTVGYTPTYGAHVIDSAFCASCHTQYTPYVDAVGDVRGEFASQTVYLEWLQSIYGKPAVKPGRNGVANQQNNDNIRSCQQCHMPEAAVGEVLIAKPVHKGVKTKNNFGKHHFVGGNVMMQNILHDHSAPLQISASSKDIKAARDRTVDQLQTATATVSIRDVKNKNGMLTAVVQVENRVGHKFPTGFPSRRTWLKFTVFDSDGEKIFESGKPETDGSVAGDNSDIENEYEPHYDLITQPDQVQIYESVMRNAEGEVTYTMMRGAGYVKDNRLLPYGFNKKAASPDIRVIGRADRDGNFLGGSDIVTYKISTGASPGPFTVTVELLYTSISYAFINDLSRDENLSLVQRFQHYYDKSDRTPVTVAVSQQTIK